MFEYTYTSYPEIKSALQELKENLKKVGIDPTLALFFLTGNLIKYHKSFSELLDCDSLCIPVEGFIADQTVWSRGALVLLLDREVNVQRFSGTTSRVCREIGDSKKFKFNWLIYPTFYFGGRLSLLNALIRERRFYSKYKKGDRDALKRASEFLENNFIYPINKILRPFRDRKEPAIALNIFPLEIKFGSPLISLNGREIKRSVIRIYFKEKIKVDYSDTFPERGKSFEETLEILRNEFGENIELADIEKDGVAIGHVAGKTVLEFMSKLRELRETEKDVIKDLDAGKFFGATPYGIWFISSETYGSSFLGLFEYPLGIYPSLYDLDKFYSQSIFSFVEETREGIEILYEDLAQKDFDFVIIDQNYILMYEQNIFKIADLFKEKIGIFSLSSASSNFRYKYMTEIEENICLNLTRNLVYLKGF